MMRKPSQIVHCISCDLSCQLFPDSAVRVQYCHNAAFSIWPDGNAFLKKGFIEKLLLDRHNHLSSGFIFVDFSFPNLRRFTDLQWADSLANSGMHIVLISDRSLTPLANYWILKSNKIQELFIPMTMILCNSKRCTACLPVGLPTVNEDERLTIRNLYY